MRQQLLKYQNECNAIKEREYVIQSKVECLQEEKRLLECEYERIPKQSEADKKIKQLKENCDELRKEAIHRKAEIHAMKEDILSKEKLISKTKKAVGKLLEKQSNLKDELVQIIAVPVQLGKETEKMNRKKVEVLEDYLNKRALEKEKQHDILIHKQKQKDREMRYLKKMELQLKMAYDSLHQIKSQHKRLKLEAETIPKKNVPLLERRRELQKEIEMKKRSLADQKMISNMDAHMLEECIAEEGRLFQEQEQCRDELSRLARLTWLKLEEKGQKFKDVRKAQIRLQNIIAEIKRKDLEIREHKKRKREVQKQ
uniref:CC146 protein n=1 Tax=Dromaius novaehollandiae TaxID=8790 RepID=A0A8C4JJ53_DRONO